MVLWVTPTSASLGDPLDDTLARSDLRSSEDGSLWDTEDVLDHRSVSRMPVPASVLNTVPFPLTVCSAPCMLLRLMGTHS